MTRLGLTTALIAILVASPASPQTAGVPTASTQRRQDVPLFSVKVIGQGRPMILIPGLSSSGAVWDGTVAHYATAYRCHVLTLAGFAGQPPSPAATPFLVSMRDSIANYIRREGLNAPVLVGHSLGGVLALSVAANYPELVGKVVSIDGPPAPGATDNPKATADDLRAMADKVAASYGETTGAARRKMLATMVTSPEHLAEIVSCGRSDPDTERKAIVEVITTDLRADLAKIKTPVLVLGTWVGWGPGVDREAVARMFEAQLSQAESAQVEVAPRSRHLLMYDEPQWMFEKMDRFLEQPAADRPLLILSHANIVDVVSGTVRRDHSVTVKDGRIAAIEPGGPSRVPAGAQVFDASGKYLIPGLVDMHVHWYDEFYLGLFLANGVTSIRVMWGMPMHLEWRRRIENGELRGPRLAIASPIVDGPNPMFPTSIVVADAESARTAVSRLTADGYDFIKVLNGVPRDAYFALIREAQSRGVPVAGHVPRSVSAAEASDSGQKSIEHLGGLPRAVTREGSEGQQQTAAAPKSEEGAGSAVTLSAAWKVNERLLASYDAAKASTVFARFVKNGTWQCPTLTLHRAHAFLHDPDFTSDERLKYMPRDVRQSWDPEEAPWLRGLRAEDFTAGRRVFAKQYELVRDMNKAGVGLLAGTDTLNPFAFPGFSLHDELSLFVEAGLSPLEALRTATINAAVYLGTEKSAGTVDVGKQADLVLLDANPLAEITNTKRIQAVVAAGRLLTRADLDGTLAKIEKLANLPSIASTLAETIRKDGVAAAIKQYGDLKAQQPDAYDYGEMELNSLGYKLLGAGQADDAVQIFKLNVEAYPNSWNVYDSLGDAYMKRGDRDLAIAAYRKSLELNPKNTNAIERLKKLGAS